jgi:hypothetical protein
MAPGDRPQVAVAVEARADLLERQAQPAQGEDAVQPAHVCIRVEAIARLAALRPLTSPIAS